MAGTRLDEVCESVRAQGKRIWRVGRTADGQEGGWGGEDEGKRHRGAELVRIQEGKGGEGMRWVWATGEEGSWEIAWPRAVGRWKGWGGECVWAGLGWSGVGVCVGWERLGGRLGMWFDFQLFYV